MGGVGSLDLTNIHPEPQTSAIHHHLHLAIAANKHLELQRRADGPM
jgi:hypothetical protein